MDIKPFFDLLGKQSRVARAFGVTDAAVLKWRKAGRIPAHREERGRAILEAARIPMGLHPAPFEPVTEGAVEASGAIPAPVVE